MKTTLKIRKFAKSDRDAFRRMFVDYFTQDFKINLTEQDFEEICSTIESYIKTGVYLDMLAINGVLKGFVNYQIDTEDKDWCQKEGWGCIREIYVSPDSRKKGYGKALAFHAESKLKDLTATDIYLTCDDNKDFWLGLGYYDTGEICTANDSSLFCKTLTHMTD